jgi:hypothetical protein
MQVAARLLLTVISLTVSVGVARAQRAYFNYPLGGAVDCTEIMGPIRQRAADVTLNLCTVAPVRSVAGLVGPIASQTLAAVLGGTSGSTLAFGNDSRIVGAEQTANKGIANGYVGLNANTAFAPSLIDPTGAAAGSVIIFNGTAVVWGPQSSGSVQSTYTASGAIAPTDNLSIVTSASPVAMTLAAGAVDMHTITIKRLGAGSVAVTATIDGVSQTVNMASAGTLKDALGLRWLATLSTYIVE